MSRVDSRLPRVDSRLTLLVLTVALLQCASAFEWQSCGEGKADIKTVTLTPESPAPGVTVQFAIKGIASAYFPTPSPPPTFKCACTHLANGIY